MIVIGRFGVSFFARRDREDQIPVPRALLPPSQRGGLPLPVMTTGLRVAPPADHHGSDCRQSQSTPHADVDRYYPKRDVAVEVPLA